MYHTYPESFTPVDLTGIGVRGVFHQRTGLALLRGRAVHFRGCHLTVIFCLKVKVNVKKKHHRLPLPNIHAVFIHDYNNQ